MGRADGVFSIAASRLSHLVKCSYTIAGFKLDNIRANSVDNARNVVALIYGWLCPLGALPVFGVRPRHDDFGDYLIIFWDWNGRVDDFHLRARVDDSFFHCAVQD